MKKYLIFSLFIALFIWISCGNKTSNTSTSIMSSKDSIYIKIAKLNELIKLNPNDAALLNNRATLYIEKLDYDSAFNNIRKALLLDSTKSKYYCTLSDIYFANGKIDKSNDALTKALILDPKNNEAYLKSAEVFLILDDYKKCFEYLSKAVEFEKINPKAYYIRGMALKQIGDTVKAISSMQTAVEQNPDYYDAYIQLGLMYASQHDDLAIDYYNNALNINPQSIEALYNMGMFYQEHNMAVDAIKSYNTILKIEPKHKNATYNIGYVNLVYLEKYNEAITYFSEVVKIDPKYTDAYYNRGLCYEMLGDFKNAKIDYQNAMRIVPNYEKAVLALNRIDNSK